MTWLRALFRRRRQTPPSTIQPMAQGPLSARLFVLRHFGPVNGFGIATIDR